MKLKLTPLVLCIAVLISCSKGKNTDKPNDNAGPFAGKLSQIVINTNDNELKVNYFFNQDKTLHRIETRMSTQSKIDLKTQADEYKDGRLAKITVSRHLPTPNALVPQHSSTYMYKDGRVSERRVTTFDGANDEITVYTYDARNFIKQMVATKQYPNSIFKRVGDFTTDAKGNVLSHLSRDFNNDQLIWTELYQAEFDNNASPEYQLVPPDDVIKYFSPNNITKLTHTIGNNVDVTTNRYSYNEAGTPISSYRVRKNSVDELVQQVWYYYWK